MVNRALVLLALAACGDEQPFACTDSVDCAADGKQGVCTSDGFCAFADATCTNGLRYHESAGDLGGKCVGGTANGDSPSSPLPLQALQTINIANTRDDITPSCSIAGGRDVFLEIAINETGRLYVDTLGTDFPHVLAFYRGSCASRGAELACVTAACNARFQQWSDILSVGTYCFVIDEAGSGGGTSLVVRSMLGPPSPAVDTPPTTVTGDTCGADFYDGTCAPSNSTEASWFLMSCTSASYTVDVNTPAFTGYLYADTYGGDELSCQTGGTPLSITQPSGPLWIMAEPTSPSTCGELSVDVSPN